MAAFAHLTHLKKLYKKIYSKEYCFVEQSLCELKAEKAKMGSNPTVVEIADTQVVESLSLIAHLLPLTDLFFLSSSFF